MPSTHISCTKGARLSNCMRTGLGGDEEEEQEEEQEVGGGRGREREGNILMWGIVG